MLRVQHTRLRGTSLIELIVSSALVGLIMFQLWALVASGSRFYLKTKSQSEIQSNALLALRWMSKDLSEASDTSFTAYLSTDPGRKGISFGSPQNGNGSVSYDKGKLLWSSVLGYYIEEDGTLYRQQRVISPSLYPPIIFSGTDGPDALSALPNPRVVARQIVKMEAAQAPGSVKITLSVLDTKLGFGLKVQTRMEMRN